MATYGTLQPGQRNHHVVSMIAGRWVNGHVVGRLLDCGWAVSMGYPAFARDGQDQVAVQVLESEQLIEHWERLDFFEGPAYQRVVVEVHTEEGVIEASIYVASDA